MKNALITGITGQDGSYLADFLLQKGYRVHGLVRRSSSRNLQRIIHLCENREFKNQFFLHDGDLSDTCSLKNTVDRVIPDEVYNLAGMSEVQTSFNTPEFTADVNGVGVLRLLDILRTTFSHSRFYQASTSELYGKVREIPQNESTSFHPRSPYAIAKLYAYWCVVNYREAYQMYACNGILFNHESPCRGENFVSRKITMAVAKIVKGLQDKLVLGNLDAQRDWGYAKDFVEGMWMVLQQENPEDYVLATGETTTVRRFVELAFREVDIKISWEGTGMSEKGRNIKDGGVLVEVSPEFFRPAEVALLIGDATKAQRKLGWSPKTKLEELVQLMVKADIQALEGNLILR